MSLCYFCYGTTLANLVNFETILTTPPHVLPDYGGKPMPLLGGAARRTLGGLLRRSGNANAALMVDIVSQAILNSLNLALFANNTAAGRSLYITTLDSEGYYSPFLCTVDCPYLGESHNIALGGSPVAVRYDLIGGVLQSVSKTTTASLTASERLVYCDTTSGGFTATLCAANAIAANTLVRIVKTSASNTLTIARAGSDTINGAATSLTRTALYSSTTLVSDGTSAWVTI